LSTKDRYKLDKKWVQKIKAAGKRIGFHLVRVTSADPARDASFYRDWIARGYHGEMAYLERHVEKKMDPKKILTSARSIICCALSYRTAAAHPITAKEGHGLISNYAWGDDYHKIMDKKLKTLSREMKEWIPNLETRQYCDTGPILERGLAARAGVGWIGKNTCLIHPTYGSYLFLGEILANIEFDLDTPGLDHCGSCTRCLDACPTDALIAPYRMDASRCIAYLTIEKRGDFTESQKKMVGDHIFGCDICQQVCPWNNQAVTPDLADFRPREGHHHPPLEAMASLSQSEFEEKFSRSPIKRAKLEGLKRNAAAILLALDPERPLE